MFLQNGGNKLDRDLANQNSLQKLSDPGGSRALDKQDWLFRRHAYITYIWARDITRRQLRRAKPHLHRKCFVRKHGQINGFFYFIFSFFRWLKLRWEAFLTKCTSLATWQTWRLTLWVPFCECARQDILWEVQKEEKKTLSCCLFIINMTDIRWQEVTEGVRLKKSQPASSPPLSLMNSKLKRGGGHL